MFAGHLQSRGQRRGVILVLILAMLGLLALIGVTFATYSGQAVNISRNFSESQNFPDSSEMMDFALSQLVDDTFNPISALRAHSLKRDMYGNDAGFNGYLAAQPGTGAALLITNLQVMPVGGPFAGLVRVTTNINAASPSFYGYDFTRWIMRIGPFMINNGTYGVAQTFEVVADDYSTNSGGGPRILYVTPADSNHVPVPNANDPLNRSPQVAVYGTPYVDPVTGTSPTSSSLAGLFTGNAFTLDGRYLRAFNGPGLNYRISSVDNNGNGIFTNYFDLNGNAIPISAHVNAYGNFRLNGPLVSNGLVTNPMGDPNSFGMDEDYDACDLDNWFLAIQSADGQSIIPSFHRPAVIRGYGSNPQFNPNALQGSDWTFTPQNSVTPLAALDSMSRILRPRAADGHSQLSFPNLLPDNTTGRITYDVDNDGDGVTDSVWLDLGYPPKRDSTGQMYKPLYSFLVIGLNGRLPLNTGGNLQSRDDNVGTYTGLATAYSVATPVPFFPLGMPSSRLGNSPSEVDLSYGLQNAFDATTIATMAQNPAVEGNFYWQQDNARVPVNLTQLRNILAGTRPQDNPSAPSGNNGDTNFALVNGVQYFMPNSVLDPFDASAVRGTSPVSGRWGEADFVPSILNSNSPNVFVANGVNPLYFVYNNPVRAGLSDSPFTPVYGDNRDDNFTTNDPFPSGNNTYPENADLLDASGLHILPVERDRRFSTPKDVSGNGLVSTYNYYNPTGGYGGDNYGRVSFQSYFRPPGFAAIWNGAGTNQPPPNTATADDWTNPLHGFDSLRNPFNVTATYPNGSWANPVPVTIARMPLVTPIAPNPVPTAPWNAAGMPHNTVNNNANPTSPPTYQSALMGVNAVSSLYGLDGLNEADEMAHYSASETDLAFTASDLEWLYRQQDTDGASLHSRLAQLAPISFLNPSDGQRRRRLYAIDAWETTNFVWANDNPPVNTTRDVNGIPIVQGAFPDNSRFRPLSNAGYATMNVNLNTVNNYTTSTFGNSLVSLFSNFTPPNNYYNNNTAYVNNYGPYLPANPGLVFAPGEVDPTPAGLVSTPQLAHRDRKVNLNFPLPVSNDCDEPIRQKWVRDTYTLLKEILPPHSVDTAQELAQLSQFVINIIDFRDPDATMTRWVNPDVVVIAANLASVPPTSPTIVSLAQAPPGSMGNLEQFGMEYNPIAINEALAYSFGAKANPGPAPVAVNRFFVELVNTLSQSGSPHVQAPTPSLLPAGFTTAPGGINSSDATSPQFNGLDLSNWELFLGEDDAYGRPDPTTGQIASLIPYDTHPGLTAGSNYGPIPLSPTSFVNPSANPATLPTLVLQALTSKTTPLLAEPGSVAGTATTLASNYYYVIGNALTTVTDEVAPPGPTTVPYPSQVQTLLNNLTAVTPANQTDWFDYSVPNNNTKLPYGLNPIQPPTAGSAKYLWVYLRRPANPLLPGSAPSVLPGQAGYNPMVVVDSMRFPYIESGGVGTPGAPDTVVKGNNQIFSAQRYQPFRGGHAVVNPPLAFGAAGVLTSQTLVPAYGYSEQMVVPNYLGAAYSNSGNYPYFGTGNAPAQRMTQSQILHTLGKANEGSTGSGFANTESWDYFPFNDRDFTSVAELMLVPGCPPGLFTKQFVENAPSSFLQTPPTNNATLAGMATLIPAPAPVLNPITGFPAGRAPSPTTILYSSLPLWVDASAGTPPQPANSYPYLIDNFFYTAASQQLLNSNANGPPGTVGNAVTKGPWWPIVGSPTGAGWHKIFDFFEVPSPAIGATGAVASGSNYDWARQDRKPGLLNLNLIIDEEVFLGVVGNAGLPNTYSYVPPTNPLTAASLYSIRGNLTSTPRLNKTPMEVLPPAFESGEVGGVFRPRIVTMTDPSGAPLTLPLPNAAAPFFRLAAYPISNQGFINIDTSGANPFGPYYNQIKACFSDFLKIRHGGTGYMFAWGTGQTYQLPDPLPTTSSMLPGGNPNPTDMPIAAERPFRSLSYPDIDFTIMRPGPLPPSLISGPPMTPVPLAHSTQVLLPAPLSWDPGVKNPYVMASTYVTPQVVNPAGSPDPLPILYPPATPPRRLFQIPDADNTPTAAITFGGYAGPNYSYTAQESNASVDGDHPFMNTFANDLSLTNPNFLLNAVAGPNNILGDRPQVVVGALKQFDNRQHPYFRGEWMQRMLNLTTVRTHQYAVWITVAFFEVTRAGDPMLANDNTINNNVFNWQLATDLLGEELNLSSGRNIRYRSFFLLDRTQAVGFNPSLPGDFRNVVVYRQTIQ